MSIYVYRHKHLIPVVSYLFPFFFLLLYTLLLTFTLISLYIILLIYHFCHGVFQPKNFTCVQPKYLLLNNAN